jgi:argininosuccinate synthase
MTKRTAQSSPSPSSKKTTKEKVVLAYSGGLDTSVILVWLVEKGFDVICFCANVGQGEEDYAAIEKKALGCGATKVYVEDLQSEFVTGTQYFLSVTISVDLNNIKLDFIYPAVQCNAIYESRYLLGTSIARPCIAKAQVKVAQAEGAKYLAHGATGKGNDQVRFEMCAQALDASLVTIAPWRDPEFLSKFKGRPDLLAYAAAHNIPVDATPKAPYSLDANLYHTSYESGMLEDPMTAPVSEMFRMTVDPEAAPDSPTFIRIEFKDGIPVKYIDKTNKVEYEDPLEGFLYLNKIAGANGVGRVDIVENRFVGIKSRGCYETPAGTVLREAHLDLEGITMDREVMRIRDGLTMEFSRLCYYGFWFSPEMEMIKNTITFSQKNITGGVEIKLYKGNAIIIGRESPCALYSADLASMDIEDGGKGLDYNPADAQGFIRINAVRLRANRMRQSLIDAKK